MPKKKQSQKLQKKCKYTRTPFPNLYAWNKPRWVDMPLKSINQPVRGYLMPKSLIFYVYTYISVELFLNYFFLVLTIFQNPLGLFSNNFFIWSYTKKLRAILNKSWRQHPTKQQLYDHLFPITKTIQVRRSRHEGHCWRSRDELISDVLLWTPHMAEQKQDGQLEHIYSSYVRIRDVALKTCQRRWTIGRSGERGSGISVLAERHDDDMILILFTFIIHGMIFKMSSMLTF